MSNSARTGSPPRPEYVRTPSSAPRPPAPAAAAGLPERRTRPSRRDLQRARPSSARRSSCGAPTGARSHSSSPRTNPPAPNPPAPNLPHNAAGCFTDDIPLRSPSSRAQSFLRAESHSSSASPGCPHPPAQRGRNASQTINTADHSLPMALVPPSLCRKELTEPAHNLPKPEQQLEVLVAGDYPHRPGRLPGSAAGAGAASAVARSQRCVGDEQVAGADSPGQNRNEARCIDLSPQRPKS